MSDSDQNTDGGGNELTGGGKIVLLFLGVSLLITMLVLGYTAVAPI